MTADSSQPASTSSGNRSPTSAEKAKQGEFYTQFGDIGNELKHYKAETSLRLLCPRRAAGEGCSALCCSLFS